MTIGFRFAAGVSWLAAALGLCGCVEARITTYLSRDVSFPEADQSTRISVRAESALNEPLLEQEVERKLASLVAEKGYTISAPHEADYVLRAEFGMDTGVEKLYSRPVSNYQGGGYRVSTETEFNSLLILTLTDVRAQTQPVCWQATTRSQSGSSDLRRGLDYLLIATMEYWGLDTGKEIECRLRQNAERVMALRAH